MIIPPRFDWILADSKIGTAQITLPDNWTELLIMIRYRNSNGVDQVQSMMGTVHKIAVFGNMVLCYGGGALLAQCTISSDLTKINLSYFGISGTDVASTSRFYVWYK